MTMKRKVCVLLLALFLVSAGAAGARYYYDNIGLPPVSPRQVIERYFAALKLQDYEKAYALVSLRHYHDSFNQFMDRVNMYSPDMRLEIAGETIGQGTAFVEGRIFVPMAFGPYTADVRMDLARIKREWKIVHP